MKVPTVAPGAYWSFLFVPALCSYIVMLQATVNKRPILGSVERLNPTIDTLIAPDAHLEVIADGNLWAEGPLWVKDEDDGRGFLLWSDVKKNRIYRWEEGGGLFTIGKSVYLEESGCRGEDVSTRCASIIEPGSNGLTLEPGTGLVVMCEHGERRVARLETNGTFTPLATHYQGKRLNSPNDLVFGPGGDLYFTDPPYGLNGKEEDPARELTMSGVYRVSAEALARQTTSSPHGSPDVQLVHDGLKRPNGLAFSPDFKTLYVANSDAADPKWLALDMDPATGLSTSSRVFASAVPFQEGGSRVGNPDGLKVDSQGNLFATGPGGVLVMNAQGERLGTILTGKKTANVAFSGEDGGYLYVCADDVVGRIPVLAKPAPSPPLTRKLCVGANGTQKPC